MELNFESPEQFNSHLRLASRDLLLAMSACHTVTLDQEQMKCSSKFGEELQSDTSTATAGRHESGFNGFESEDDNESDDYDSYQDLAMSRKLLHSGSGKDLDLRIHENQKKNLGTLAATREISQGCVLNTSEEKEAVSSEFIWKKINRTHSAMKESSAHHYVDKAAENIKHLKFHKITNLEKVLDKDSVDLPPIIGNPVERTMVQALAWDMQVSSQDTCYFISPYSSSDHIEVLKK